MLPAFQQSVFLQSLGWAIANNLWQCAILWMLYQIIISSYKEASAKFKNNLSAVLLFGNFLWFVSTLFTKLTGPQNAATNTVDQLINYRSSDVIESGITLQKIISSIIITLPYLSVAYLLLLLFFSVKLINSYHNTNVLKNSGLSKPGAEWRLFVERVSHHININKKIKIWFSKYVDVPATIGFFKPVILIPLASVNQLTTEQMEAIILHEIAHIQRNDYLLNLIVSLIETILFFNPFVVIFSKIIKKERENCCDDFVLQYQYDRHSYASALLVLEKSRTQEFQLALTATSGRRQLLYRIKRIMEVKNNNDGLIYGQKLLALLLCTGIICSVAWLTPEKHATEKTKKQLAVKTLQLQPGRENKLESTSIKSRQKTPGKILFIKGQPLETDANNLKIIPKNITDKKNNKANTFLFNDDNETAAEPFAEKAFSNSFMPAQPNIISPGDIYNAPFFSPGSFLPDVKLPDNMHINVNLDKLISSLKKDNLNMDWAGIRQLLKQNADRIKSVKFQLSIKNDKLKLAAPEEMYQRDFEFQMLQCLNNVRDQFRKIKADSLSLFKDNGINIFLKGSNDILPPPPPPQQVLKREKNIPPSPVVQQSPDHTQFKFEYNVPSKIKITNAPSVQINKGLIIINGKKINLPDFIEKKMEKEKKPANINKNNTYTIEI